MTGISSGGLFAAPFVGVCAKGLMHCPTRIGEFKRYETDLYCTGFKRAYLSG
jgi:hypothetical protein